MKFERGRANMAGGWSGSVGGEVDVVAGHGEGRGLFDNITSKYKIYTN